jgi:hypothetical protein
MRLPPHRLGIVAVAVLATACGSTLPLATQRQLENGGGAASAGGLGGSNQAGGQTATNAGSVPSGSAGSAVSGASPGAGGAGGSITGGGSVGSTGAISGPGATVPGRAGGPSATKPAAAGGPGVTASTIYVGDQYDPDAAAEDSGLGAAGLNPGDTQAETNAVVAYINAHGGVAHRKLAVVWAQISGTSNIQQSEQAACNTWTVDNKVLSMPAGVAVWDQCVASAHAIGVTTGDIAQETSAIMRQYPADFNLTGITLDRSERYTIEGIQRQGYFPSGAKVGIVTWDGSDFRYGAGLAQSQLARMGFPNVPVEYISEPQTEGDIGTSSSDVSNAILKFRSEGIDHVLLFDGTAGVFSGAGLTLLFMNAANSQQYFPEYGLNSTSGLSTTAPDVPSAEIKNSMAIGWIPSIDLSSADYAAYPVSSAAKTCLQIMAAAGQTASGANAEANQFELCDHYFFLQQVLDRISGPIDQASAVAAIQSLGTSFPVISTFQADFTATQHDGVAVVRNAGWVGSCSCFRYSSSSYNPG